MTGCLADPSQLSLLLPTQLVDHSGQTVRQSVDRPRGASSQRRVDVHPQGAQREQGGCPIVPNPAVDLGSLANSAWLATRQGVETAQTCHPSPLLLSPPPLSPNLHSAGKVRGGIPGAAAAGRALVLVERSLTEVSETGRPTVALSLASPRRKPVQKERRLKVQYMSPVPSQTAMSLVPPITSGRHGRPIGQRQA